jgi:hypothetical protein
MGSREGRGRSRGGANLELVRRAVRREGAPADGEVMKWPLGRRETQTATRRAAMSRGRRRTFFTHRSVSTFDRVSPFN